MLGTGPGVSLDGLADAVDPASAEATVRRIPGRGGTTLDPDWEESARAEDAWREAVGRLAEAQRRSRRRVPTRAVGASATTLRAESSTRRRVFLDLEAARFLNVLPLWIGTLTEIEDTLSPEPPVFDVVVLDEASQIDQLRAAAALARARPTVVVGDSRQLRHVSFVDDEAMAAAAQRQGIEGTLHRQVDVRRSSLLDAAAAAASVTELVEHFRSVPHIIGLTDRRFYGGRLALTTQHPATEARDAIGVGTVDGERVNGVDAAEVEAVTAEVEVVSDRGVTSIGVVTPFRAQADAIEAAILERLGRERLEAGGVRAGTTHAFQANERDVTVLSLAVGPADLRGLGFMEDPNLLNAMVTRAREEVVGVTSLITDGISDGLLRDYLRWAAAPPSPSRSRVRPRGWVAEIAAVASHRVPVVGGYPVARYRIDLTVGRGPDVVGVECEVYREDPVAHPERHRDLVRAGWVLRDVFQSRWLAVPEEAVRRLVEGFLAPEQASGRA